MVIEIHAQGCCSHCSGCTFYIDTVVTPLTDTSHLSHDLSRNVPFRKRSLPFLRDFELLLKYFTIIGGVSTVEKKSSTENRTLAFSLQMSLPYHYTTPLTRQNSEKFKDIL